MNDQNVSAKKTKSVLYKQSLDFTTIAD